MVLYPKMIMEALLSDGSVALSFINVSLGFREDRISISPELIRTYIGSKMTNSDDFVNAKKYKIMDIWTKEESEYDADEVKDKGFCVNGLAASDNLTIRITPVV